jgi:hypothetical protein
MSDLGYHTQIQGGIFGRPDSATSPEQIADLQAKYAQMAIDLASAPGHVPECMGGSNDINWAVQPGGPANLPKIGWTAQNGSKSAFVEQPGEWTAEGMGHIPDWTADNNGLAAGQYDMTPVVAYGDYNPLNRGPLGDGPMQGAAGVPPNPNVFPEDGGSLNMDYEY